MLSLQFNSVPSLRRGLSLVEVLIAMVMTLVVLGAMMSAFSYGSAEMQKGRASIELNNRLITAEEQLRRDLDRITVELKPHHQLPALPKGYVEIVDGPQTDYVPANDATFAHGGNQMVFGDRDDFFACTIKSDGKAFRGRRQYGTNNDVIESHLAEVAWFTIFDPATTDTDDVLTIRRQLLILPSLGTVGVAGDYNTFIANNDISVRVEGGNLVANSLADLAVRGNRFSHANTGAPNTSVLQTLPLDMRCNENHIMFSSVAAFDIQVFDPNAFVRELANGDIAEPSDIGAKNSVIGERVGIIRRLGGYVDLGKGIIDTSVLPNDSGSFGESPTIRIPPGETPGPHSYTEYVYDTGTSQYDRASANELGSNGVDDNGNGRIDESDTDVNGDGEITPGNLAEVGERTAVPPYNEAIRGLKFTMRVLEPNTKQVRQLTVKKSFVAE